MPELLLSITEASFTADAEGMRWHWRLTDEAGSFLGDHQAVLCAADGQYQACQDLPGYLRRHTPAPDTRLRREAELLEEVGSWLAEHAFGPLAAVLGDQAPCTVRVQLPEPARAVALLPLEAALVESRPLALRDVVLVHAVGEPLPTAATPDEKPVRILALFSLPTGGTLLNLRRERYELERLVHEIAATRDRAVELRVLQYGTTEERLREAVEEGDGWDIVHLSGHGRAGVFALEHEDGTPDRKTPQELVERLRPLRRSVRLVIASACSSAEPVAAEHRRLLGVPDGNGPTDGSADTAADSAAGGEPDAGQAPQLDTLAMSLARDLRCAVLGMRHPVGDDFAAAFTTDLYRLLLDKRQPLPRAAALALQHTFPTDGPTPTRQALAASTPALFGDAAATLRLTSAAGDGARYGPDTVQLAGLPEQPPRFVGRGEVMLRAHAALASRSGYSGVLLYGMAGAGKTTAATELAYLHRDSFPVVAWYGAPDEGHDITCALADLAGVLGQKIENLDLRAVTENHQMLRGEVLKLTELFRRRRILLVIDNAESLLTEDGAWRDARWGTLMDALTGHSGLSRLVLTSRRRPARLDSRVLEEPVNALTPDESTLLARELPHLGGLFADTDGRELLGRVLTLTRGHPVLLEIADGHAAAPDTLRALLDQAEDTWKERGKPPEGFFTRTADTGASEDYLALLHTWTTTATRDLDGSARVLLHMLACIEPDDRRDYVIDATWADLWHALDRPDPVPDWRAALAALTTRGLADTRHQFEGRDHVEIPLHPAIAATAREQAGPRFQEAADHELGASWTTTSMHFLEREAAEAAGEWFTRAARAALPYLLRLGDTRTVTILVEAALKRDDSPASVMTLLPIARANANTARATDGETSAEIAFTKTLLIIDPAEAESRMRTLLTTTRDADNHWSASVIASHLIIRCCTTGRLSEALALAEQMIEDTQRAGLGPWTQTSDRAQRLQILQLMGEHAAVLEETRYLLAALDQTPALDPALEAVEDWNVREDLLGIANPAALGLERWQEALDLNARRAESQSRRGAPELELARTRFNDYGPLLELGRLDEAETLLTHCHQVFEHHHAWTELGLTLTALAHCRSTCGEHDRAIAIEEDALRYHYLAGALHSIAIGHFNFGNSLGMISSSPAVLTHHLSAALIYALTHHGELQNSLYITAQIFAALPFDGPLPTTVDALCAEVDQLPGVHFADLLDSLATPKAAQAALDQILQASRQLAQELRDQP